MADPTTILYVPGGSIWILIVISLGLYFIPTMVAANRGKASTGSIFFLNLLLGWTVIGWVGSLIWALSADRNASSGS